MKKIILLLMAIALCLSLIACGGASSETVANPTEAATEAPAAFVPQRSTFDAATSTFYNEQTGIRCTFPADWYQYTEDYIAKMMFGGISADALAAMTPEEFSQMEIVTDFMITHKDGKDFFSIGICNGALVYPDAENPADTYGLSIYATVHAKGEVFAEDTVSLSGQEFKLISAKIGDYDYHYAYRSIDKNYVLYLVYTTAGNFTPEFIWDMFNGGVKVASSENLPSRHVYDADYNRLINEHTGIIIDVPSGWDSATHAYVAETYYGITEDELNSLTPEVLTQLQRIHDMYLWDYAGTADMQVSYVNVNNFSKLYGATDDEMYQVYLDSYTDETTYEQIAYEYDDVVLCGRTYKVIEVIYSGANNSYKLIALSRLNEDYLIEIVCHIYDDSNYVDFWSMFERNNDDGKVSDFIRPSSYDAATRHFYNEYTGIGLTVPKSWTVLDGSELYDYLYGDSAKPGDFDNYTEEDYNNLWALADFSIREESSGDFVYAYYENLNLWGDGSYKPDIYEYYDYQKQLYEKNNWTIINESCYILSGYEVMIFTAASNASGSTATNYVGIAQVNDDYAFIMECMSDGSSNEFKFWTMLDKTSPEREQEIMAMYG